MKLIYHKKGPNPGRINVTQTLLTIEVGESWTATAVRASVECLRNACSYLKRNTGRVFTVNYDSNSNRTVVTRTL
ncbi:MAG: hypothetical protein BWY69_00200 [Planctomycetes bacterium ADurb.Bin401]|jgi:hypothetical protein|nr:MAG: hypothetical protein BWY69_00200 [Planctomycetes bacterium ADurb.Bin401]